jgi:outer membrane protein assembly factor BamE (lipoprotein component of BamABCDE complex)
MNGKAKYAMVLMAALLLLGCASSGNKILKQESKETIESKIVQGETTKQQVRDHFGDPLNTNYTDSGNEIWTYQYDKMALSAGSLLNPFKTTYNGTRKQLVVFFDDRGIVKRFNMNESPHKTEQGILP